MKAAPQSIESAKSQNVMTAKSITRTAPRPQRIEHPNHPQRALLQFQQTIGNQAVRQRLIQAKLTIGQPNDRFEREADRVADEVMRMPSSQIAAPTGVFSSTNSHVIRRLCPKCQEDVQPRLQPQIAEFAAGPSIQRICPECEEDLQRQPEEEETVQRKDRTGATPQVTPSIASGIHSLKGVGRPLSNSMREGGHPLPATERAFFEPRFGHDFSKVRIHTDARTRRKVEALSARAFTIDWDVAFGSRQYAPRTVEGRRLPAHELAHVVQQSQSSGVRVQRKPRPPSDQEQLYWQIRRLADLNTDADKRLKDINQEVDRRFWTMHASDIPWGTKLDPTKAKHRPLVRSWLDLRDNVLREQMRGTLGIADVSGHWEFHISGDSVRATSTPGASCDDLADGTLCEGPDEATLELDVTRALPAWVRGALAAQAASGIRFIQQSPDSKVEGYHPSQFDLGFGNCHGSSTQFFAPFADVPITEWVGLEQAPKRVPKLFGDLPIRDQIINVEYDKDPGPKAIAEYMDLPTFRGTWTPRWRVLLTVGHRTLLKRVEFLGGTLIEAPVFGSWGLRKEPDHSVIALGRVGEDRVYVLQKMSPFNPYFINVTQISDYDWYDVPPSQCTIEAE